MKEQEAAREERSLEAVRRELAKTEAALAALRTEHEDLAAARAQLIRTVHRLEVLAPVHWALLVCSTTTAATNLLALLKWTSSPIHQPLVVSQVRAA